MSLSSTSIIGQLQACSLAMILAVLFATAAVVVAAASHPHPLDPLSGAELTAVRAAVLASPLVPARPLHFHYVGLDEPDKADALSYATSTAALLLPRRALVIARAGGQSNEPVVDVTDASVLSHSVHRGAGYPMMTTAEQAAAMALPPAYPPFVDSVGGAV